MQTPGRQIQSTSSMLGDRRRSNAAQNSVSTTKLLTEIDKLSQNVTSVSGQLELEKKNRITSDNLKEALLKREKKSLEDLKSSVLDIRKIFGAAAGLNAIRQFSQGDISGGLKDTGLAITAFLPEIIGITQNVIVGGLAARGMLGGGAPRMGGGRAGLLALPLLALAPLLMGGRRNNQSNAPTAEFRREQQTRRIRKDTIAANDTLRFGAQLDRFDRILSSLGKKETTEPKLDPIIAQLDQTEEEQEVERNFNDRLTSFLELLNPFAGTTKLFETLFGTKTKQEQAAESKQRMEDVGLGGISNAIRNILGIGKKKETNNENEGRKIKENNKESNNEIEGGKKEGNLDDFEAGAFTEVSDEDAERIIKEEDSLEEEDRKGEKEQPFSSVRDMLENISKSLTIGDDNKINFSGVIDDPQKATKMTSTVSNFLNFIQDDFIPNLDEEKLETTSQKLMSNMVSNIPEVKKETLEEAPPLIKSIFSGAFGDDGKLDVIEDVKTQFHNESGSAVGDVFVDPRFKKSFDKFYSQLMIGIFDD